LRAEREKGWEGKRVGELCVDSSLCLGFG